MEHANIPKPSIRRGVLAAMGLLCALAAMPAYMVLMDIPLVRSTALPTWALLVLGCGLSLVAVSKDRRWWIWAIAGVTTLMLIGAPIAWFVLARLPTPDSALPAAGAVIADFTLPDESGIPVSIAQEFARGPVLLVFYRGFW
jgi:hypothetical protein